MYGFTIMKGLVSENTVTNGRIKCDDFICENNFISKFNNDKLFYEDDCFIVILDGVILNKNVLCRDNNWIQTVINLYKEYNDSFCSKFKGNFSGALYDKRDKKWIIFTDHLGQKFIYYSIINDKFICSSLITNIYEIFKLNKINYELDSLGISFLLSYGFMLNNTTLCKEIKKIQPGCYLVFKDGKLQEKHYYKLNNKPNENISYNDCIEQIDVLFRDAVKTQFEKDREYGYKHICSLSAGLDCRMTSYVAHDLGYTRQLNITFSESEYWDHIIPQKMAIDWKHDWIFKPLDNGMWLYDIEEITKFTGGNVLYYGLAHGNSLTGNLNFEKYGMLHTGQLGDVIISTHMKNYEEKYRIGEGAYSKIFLKEYNFATENYDNLEMGLWYTRYLNGTNNGLAAVYNYTESCSPFEYLDFLEFCLSIPVDFRYNHRIYKDWILKKYPKAADYVWETIGRKITDKTIKILGREVPIKKIPKRILEFTGRKLGIKTNRKYSMQQLKTYLNDNKDLSKFLYGYFDYLDVIKDEHIKNTINKLWESGGANEKIQIVSLLAAIKLYFC